MPATVANLVSLKERSGDIDGASQVLDSAITYWSNAMTKESQLTIIMQEAVGYSTHEASSVKNTEGVKPLIFGDNGNY
ncbi:hypothetical protein L2E82_25656 [Cichorium intybus]|uniref:Uncharacterized protein n=1 Tax=Cichorium intybus TaxID=13427 RepID=A0ACB9E4P7_CICIN|nr:hypothetical protein L2E82_25656 [Cichorium intybus]